MGEFNFKFSEIYEIYEAIFIERFKNFFGSFFQV